MSKPMYSAGMAVSLALLGCAGCASSTGNSIYKTAYQSVPNYLVPLSLVIDKPDHSVQGVPAPTDLANESAHDVPSAIGAITAATLQRSDKTSPARSNVLQEQSSYKELKWEALPNLIPSANVRRASANQGSSANNLNNREYRLTIQQELLDFGRYASRSAQAVSRIKTARIEYWQERNQIVHDALVNYTETTRHKALHGLSKKYHGEHLSLLQKIQSRLSGGITDRSELALIQIRVRELQTQMETDARTWSASQQQLATYTGPDLAVFSEQLLETDSIAMMPFDFTDTAPAILLARQEIALAKAETKEAKSSLFPRLVAEAYVETVDGIQSEGVGLRLTANTFAGFSYRSRLSSVSLRMDAAKLAVQRAQQDLNRETSRLNLSYRNLLARSISLSKQQIQVQESVALFLAQFSSGVKPIIDAIRVYESALDTERQIVNNRADIQLNRLQVANLFGAIADFPEA